MQSLSHELMSLTLVPLDGFDLIRTEMQLRVETEDHSEEISLTVLLPSGNRTLSTLQSEAIRRAQHLLSELHERLIGPSQPVGASETPD